MEIKSAATNSSQPNEKSLNVDHNVLNEKKSIECFNYLASAVLIHSVERLKENELQRITGKISVQKSDNYAKVIFRIANSVEYVEREW